MANDKYKKLIPLLEVLLLVDDLETIHCAIESLLEDLKDDEEQNEEDDTK